MKVFLVQPFGHKGGHYPTETWKLARSISEKGLELVIVSFSGFINKSNEEIDSEGYKHLSFTGNSGFLDRFVILNLIRFLCLISFNRLIKRCVSTLETYFALKIANQQTNENTKDLIFCYDAELISFLYFCTNENGKNFVLGRMEYGRTLPINTGRTIKRKIENYLCKKAISKNSIKFICRVDGLEDSFVRTGFPGELRYISPIGIVKPNIKLEKQEARKLLNLPQNKTILLVFGIGHPGKSYETIFKAIHNIDDEFVVVFAGLSLPVNNANLLAKKYNCEDRTLIFDKYISDTDQASFFYSADYLILSYTKAFAHDSAVLIDAMKYSLPVIACDSGWIGKIVKNHNLGKTFLIEKPDSLAEQINNCLGQSKDEQIKIRDNMSKMADENSITNIADEYISIFRDTIKINQYCMLKEKNKKLQKSY